jgi:hypothetical protein
MLAGLRAPRRCAMNLRGIHISLPIFWYQIFVECVKGGRGKFLADSPAVDA